MRYVLALSLSVALTSSAFADCAWVLWQMGSHQTATFHPVLAYQTLSECNAGMQREREGMKVLGETKTYRCLPDTIDPRGPKGK